MNLPSLTPSQWICALAAALFIGLAKSGLAGIGMLPILLMAQVMPARESTGAILPLLVCGDLFAIATFRRHAQWNPFWRMLPVSLTGVVLGYFGMGLISDAVFRPLLGGLILCLLVLQGLRRFALFERVPHSRGFAWGMGLASGFTTMLANAAGPIMTLYFLAIGLPKLQFVGTSAWFFLILNLTKLPFSHGLGLINAQSLSLDLILVPAVGLGILLGHSVLPFIPQRIFEILLLIFAAAAAVRLIVF